uniref:Uncharacterized protein n=1 Tax=Nelumbo nucifera TaxID=4432 RepID=A0A822Y2I2_NELNU|nr:TPA_asm: hypothetical protein HUJ06_029582 [Nelumbo nucifera]
MAIRGDLLKKWVLMITFLYWVSLNNVSAVCELSVVHRDGLYNFSLASPTQEYPHGVLSEDGFYKVAVNETVLWFQVGLIRLHFVALFILSYSPKHLYSIHM